MKPLTRKQRTAIDQLLKWRTDATFMRPDFSEHGEYPFVFDPSGLPAYEAFHLFDSTGKRGLGTSEPELLKDILQARRLKAFTEKGWRDDYYGYIECGGELVRARHEYGFFPEETLAHPAMEINQYLALFDRVPFSGICEAAGLAG